MILPPNKLLGSASHLALGAPSFQKRVDEIADEHRRAIEARAMYLGKTDKGNMPDVR